MTEIVFNDGEEDYKISKIRIIDNSKGPLRLVIYPENKPTRLYFFKVEDRG